MRLRQFRNTRVATAARWAAPAALRPRSAMVVLAAAVASRWAPARAHAISGERQSDAAMPARPADAVVATRLVQSIRPPVPVCAAVAMPVAMPVPSSAVVRRRQRGALRQFRCRVARVSMGQCPAAPATGAGPTADTLWPHVCASAATVHRRLEPGASAIRGRAEPWCRAVMGSGCDPCASATAAIALRQSLAIDRCGGAACARRDH